MPTLKRREKVGRRGIQEQQIQDEKTANPIENWESLNPGGGNLNLKVRKLGTCHETEQAQQT